MKRSLTLLAAVLAIAAAASCKKDNISEPQQANGGEKTFRAIFDDTKMMAYVTPDGKTVSSYWTPGDMIFIADDKCTEPNCPILNTSEDPTSEAYISGGGTALTIKYTPKENATFIYAAFMGNGTKTYIANEKAEHVTPGFAWGGATYAESSYFAASTPLTSSTLVFRPIFGLLEFSVTDANVKSIDVTLGSNAVPSDFDYNFKMLELTVNEFQKEFTIYVNGPGTCYIPIVPGCSVNGFSFTAKKEDDSPIFTVSSAKTISAFEAGKIISLGVLDSHAAPAVTKVTEISTAADWSNFVAASAANLYAPADVITLKADIDLSAGFAPVDTLKCGFDGGGKTITYAFSSNNLASDAALNGNLGLFRVSYGNIQNLKVAGTIDHSSASGTYCIGGVVGLLKTGCTVKDCESSVNITATTKCSHRMGGIVGFSEVNCAISGCTNKGAIKHDLSGNANASQLGGIVGHIEVATDLTGNIDQGYLYFKGNGTPRMAGMCGYINNLEEMTIKDCSCSSTIEYIPTVKWSSGWAYIGGITGYFGTATATGICHYDNCSFSGKIISDEGNIINKARIGGIASHNYSGGTTEEFKGCTYDGEIVCGTEKAGYTIAGGILGFSEATGVVKIEGCTVKGKITSAGGGYIGGLFGGTGAETSTFTDNLITKDFVLTSTAASSYLGALCGKNTAFTTAMTGQVEAAKISNNGVETVLSEENYQSMLCGVALGEGGSTTGVTFKN